MAIDNFFIRQPSNLSSRSNAREITLVEGSILDTFLLKSLVEKSEYVFHFAALLDYSILSITLLGHILPKNKV
jgi:nucleoside-diphosphate-sugar epimerase